jgi:hypothetical protein
MAGTPGVDYIWGFSPLLVPGEPPTPGYNFDRLVSLTYPERPQDATRRTVTLDYGNNTNDLDSALSRVTTIYDSGAQTDVGGYKYMGTGRRVSTTFGNGVAQTFAGGGGYAGLDRYGRMIDLNEGERQPAA